MFVSSGFVSFLLFPSFQDVETFGDDFVSGLSLTLTLTYLFVRRYSHQSRLIDIITWSANMIGMACILVAKEHYSIDCLCAFALAYFLDKHYHEMADAGVHNLTINPLGVLVNFFEKNVNGKVWNVFNQVTFKMHKEN